MANPSGKKGTAWESEIIRVLHERGWKYAERRRLNGNYDRGDIAGIPGFVIEAKNCRKVELGPWIEEATKERDNDNAAFGVVWHKRRGKSSALDGFVTMDGDTFLGLLHLAGYGGYGEAE